MKLTCPHCGVVQPTTNDPFCSDCRERLDEPPNAIPEKLPEPVLPLAPVPYLPLLNGPTPRWQIGAKVGAVVGAIYNPIRRFPINDPDPIRIVAVFVAGAIVGALVGMFIGLIVDVLKGDNR